MDKDKIDDGREDKNPWTKWYWADWVSDTGIRACSLAAQGLWMNMLSIMARSKKKGYLLDNEKQMESKTLARLLGLDEKEVILLIEELRKHGVFSEDEIGIYNRRMAREGAISIIRSQAGKLGGRPRKQKESKKKAKGFSFVKAPSASASASASNSSLNKNLKEGDIRGVETDIKLVQLLIDLMLENNPESSTIKRLTPKRQEEWIRQCRLLRERDGRTPEQIEAIIRFSQVDSFWKGNILSMPKLREKWDQLFMKAKKDDQFSGIKDWLKEEQVKENDQRK